MLAAPFSALQSASFSLLNEHSLNFLEGVPHKARVTMRKHVIDAVMVRTRYHLLHWGEEGAAPHQAGEWP